jgi:ligand-binding sensor domain-containing protein
MKIGFIAVSIFLLFSCGKQNKTFAQETKGAPKTIAIAQPKIIKKQGTGQFATLHCGLEDKNGNLWFGTTGEGIYRYHPSTQTFTNYTVEDGVTSNTVWCVLEDRAGNIWFGTANGICRYGPSSPFNAKEKTFSSIPIVIAAGPYFPSNSSSKSDPSLKNQVWCIMQDKTGKFWFGTSNGIYTYNGVSFSYFLHDDGITNNTGLQINSVENILEDKNGGIWFGGRLTEGVFCFDPVTKILKGFTPDKKEWLRPLFEDKTGNSWFGTRNHSLYRLDHELKTFTIFGEKEIDGWVVSVVQDKSANLWFSSENGLMRYNDKEGFSKLTKKNGLINNDIFSLTLDKSGNIWIGTRNIGLCRYDPSSKIFTNFSE